MHESHTKCVKVGCSEVIMVMQSPHQGVVTLITAMLTATTGVTICDCLNLAVTVRPHLKIVSDPVTTV